MNNKRKMKKKKKINDWVQERLPVSLTSPMHPYRPGDAVWVKEWNVRPLKPHCRGPFVFILSTPTAVKVAEIAPWMRYSRVRPASPEWKCIPDPVLACMITLQNVSALPLKYYATWETTGDHKQDNNPTFLTPEAD
jgi:hypothetical protein